MLKRLLCLLLLFSVCACDKPLADDLDEARTALAQMDWAQAEKLLERALRTETDPKKRWDAWNLLIKAAAQVDTSNIPDYLDAMQLEFDDDKEKQKTILNRLADLRESARQYDPAIKALRKLALLEPDTAAGKDEQARIQRRIGHIYLRMRQFSAAQDTVRVCLDLAPSAQIRAACLYDQAEVLCIMEHNDQAADFARQALAIPEAENLVKGMAAFLLADILELQGKKPEALEQFEAARPFYPNEMVIDARIDYLRKGKK